MENEAHLMPLGIRLSELDQSRQDEFLAWIERNVSENKDPPPVMFVDADTSVDSLLTHLRRLLVITLSSRRQSLFRYYDPSVIRHFDWLFNESQRAALYGPAERWVWWNNGVWQATSKPRAKRPLRFRPDAIESARLGRVAALNSVLKSLEEPQVPESFAALCLRLDSFLARAQKKGWRDERDWEAFAEKCHDCHPNFDEHPRVVQLLEQARKDECAFSDVVCVVDDEFWQAIRADLSVSNAAME